ncbi:hypothetical protein QYE76_060458 [Lolium multiflorum]|uniref:WRC domain-containing protein n=1 Tax=Lolium multiflorum TaxID=4521 RepID=A0AAD8S0G9_LOLMU|nr:hypothetical protein QYE76_060458 [Lolium multiflorum]
MRIRRNASRLLGSAVCAPPRFELPPPSGFELPPPADESHLAGVVSKISSASPEPCEESFSPWDLMGQLDLSDPQEEERFVEAYSVPVPVAWQASRLFSPTMPAGSLEKEELEKEHMAVDMVNGVILELDLAEKNKAARRMARKKNESYWWRVTPEEEVHESGHGKAEVESSDPARGSGAQSWTCQKNNSKGWPCRRPVSQPGSLCRYHSDQNLPGGWKPRRKRTTALGVGEGFYYYTGFGPSRSTKRQRSVLEEPTLHAQDKEEAQLPEEHIDDTTSDPAETDQADHRVPRRDNKSMVAITGWDEEISSSDDDSALQGCNGEPAPGMIKSKSPSKKRSRKHMKARSINSLM